MAILPIVLVGLGPANLAAAYALAKHGFKVNIYEQKKAGARKFLVAGHGGFNLTHAENISLFITRYSNPFIGSIVEQYPNTFLTDWLSEIGIPTFEGSSGKVFPEKGIKPIQVLQKILDTLEQSGVQIFYSHRMTDFTNEEVHFENTESKSIPVKYHKLILGLGGASWPQTGADAKWIDLFKKKNIAVTDLEPANSGFNVSGLPEQLNGTILKNVTAKFGEYAKQGDVVLTTYGIEGAPIYYLNRFIRKQGIPGFLHLDLKPQQSVENILSALKKAKNISEALRQLKLSPAAITLLKLLDKSTFINPGLLGSIIKNYPVKIEAFRPLEEVISTAGGVEWHELNPDLSLKKFSNVHCIGEMLDWEAPTGGYLLQACFSTGFYTGNNIVNDESLKKR
ncbi:TIGR03862 family flavoprotein [Polluticaenibacter yanchengensis]|uniref:TIGR03862 family flavoprotein n=1 Tax=Polluticaenibacter yanchengensis TaxID=3014562 RepID=A0ABT4UN57_9BACT|nr:TIGR03862 family flavoprotein [Chitinophagaceae bacterium LY-5]